MKKKLEKEKERITKLRDRASKSWDTQKFYYYQGQIDFINEMLTNTNWGL